VRIPEGIRQRAWRVYSHIRNRRFRPRLRHDPAGPAIVLSPHLDDAVIDCWSVLAGTAPVTVATVCAGIPKPGPAGHWDALAGARDRAERMRDRREEDLAALALAGRSGVHLPFPQADHRPGPPPPLEAIDRALVGRLPSACTVYAPAVLGTRHPDHALVRDYALALAAHGVPVILYADAPYAVIYGWPSWVTGAPRDPHLDVDFYWRATGRDDGLTDATRAQVVRLTAPQAAAKLAAMRAYRSQFSMLDRGPTGLLSNPAIHGYEVFWRVPGAP
jgi:LmbE family N-acetylglucosaminyl deacetylase